MSTEKFVPADGFNGSPVIPTGDPMIDGVGPAAWAEDRADRPDLTFHGAAKIVPMRVDPAFSIAKGDPDPRGLPVIAADKVEAGTVVEVWVNRSEPQIPLSRCVKTTSSPCPIHAHWQTAFEPASATKHSLS